MEYVGLDGEDLPLEDGSVDHVLTTWTLCTIPDVPRALDEVSRVLRPGGSLHFLEHGRSTDPKVAKWQDRITPLQRRLAGGCHLNRPIDRLIADSPLQIDRLENYELPRPEVARVHVRRCRDARSLRAAPVQKAFAVSMIHCSTASRAPVSVISPRFTCTTTGPARA